MRDKGRIRSLEMRLRWMMRADNPLDLARAAAEMRDLADQLVAESIREANQAGQTWRQIGAELGVPFQTLYRRYCADERDLIDEG